ncbi:MAG: hypothetical protein AAF989_14545 [Planctomycetota bacterium]
MTFSNSVSAHLATSALALACLCVGWNSAQADQSNSTAAPQSILHEDTDDDATGVLLRYDLKVGETIPYEVTHVAKTKTSVRGNDEISNVRTVSRRHWKVVERLENGNMVFDHVIDSVEMTQQTGDAEEIRWNSTSGEDPPPAFKLVAERIGRTLATITVDPRGEEIKRENHGGSEASLGMGSLTLHFPEKKMKPGDDWSVPREVRVRTDDGIAKIIKIREVYTLKNVKTGVATLRIRSEPLTPIDKESVRAQVIQQLSNGTLRFDVDNGRMLEKQLDWDENVVGFQGPTSAMEYRAKMTESLIEAPTRTAALRTQNQ